jgi:hypothetical protein
MTRIPKRTGRYRSKFESKIAKALVLCGQKVKYEVEVIEYTIPESNHKYTPDFLLPNGIRIEAKGRLTAEDRKKMLWVKRSNPDLDIRFVFMRGASPIRKGSKTTYGMWAEKNGFKWAEKTIPETWINEKKKSAPKGRRLSTAT